MRRRVEGGGGRRWRKKKKEEVEEEGKKKRKKRREQNATAGRERDQDRRHVPAFRLPVLCIPPTHSVLNLLTNLSETHFCSFCRFPFSLSLHSLLLYLFFSLCFSFFFLLSSKGPRENCVRENCKRDRDKDESINLARIFSALPACGCQNKQDRRETRRVRVVCVEKQGK